MRREAWLGIVAASVWAAASGGCDAVLGIPDPTLVEGSGASTTGGTGGAGTAGGTGGASTSTTGGGGTGGESTSTTGSGGTGGASTSTTGGGGTGGESTTSDGGGGSGPETVRVLGDFAGGSIAGTAGGIRVRGTFRWQSAVKGQNGGIVVKGWLR